jgi:tetratricopeptide (TPR) repeat protein
MLMLHLRSGTQRPMLAGNQAAMHYFSGAAVLRSGEQALHLAVDHWWTPTGSRSGGLLRLADAPRALLQPPMESGAAPSGTAEVGEGAEGAEAGKRGGRRLRAWHIGPAAAEVAGIARHVQWQHAASLRELLASGALRRGTHVVLVLDEEAVLPQVAGEIAEVRQVVGARARIVVRESRRQLRAHLEKRLLLDAGVDAVLAAPGRAPGPDSRPGARQMAAEATALLDLLTRRPAAAPPAERHPVSQWLAAFGEEPLAGHVPAARFADEAVALLRHARGLGVPCTLAEVQFEGATARAPEGAALPVQLRAHDLATAVRDGQIVLLRGCREHDALQAVRRWIAEHGGRRLCRMSLYADDTSIDEHLARIAQSCETVAEMLHLPEPAPPPARPAPQGAAPLVALSAMARASRSAVVSMWGVVSTALALFAAGSEDSRAQTQPATAPAHTAAGASGDGNATSAYLAGRYAEAARLGLAEIEREPGNHELRLRIANSLAWTGRYAEAMRQYEALADTPLATEAALGLALVHLWAGRPERADPLFRRVLAATPQKTEALEGLARAGRQLRPRSTVRVAALADSNDAERTVLGLAHRWRDASLQQVFEVSAEGGSEKSPAVADQSPRELTFAYEHQGLAWAPRVQVSAQDSPTSKFFGGAAVKLADGRLTLDAARVNWGRLVFDPRALRDGLTARRVGLGVQADSAIGQWQGSLAQFDVSDDNRVREVSLRLTPQWQPLAAAHGVRFFAGAYSRDARRADSRYWSPTEGYTTADFGASLGRWEAQWEFYGEVKRSVRLAGEGARGWSVGLSGRRWLDDDWAVRADASTGGTRRDASRYRSRSASLALDRLW